MPPQTGRALVRVPLADAQALNATTRWWLVTVEGLVLVPLSRDGDGKRAISEGAPWCSCGRDVYVPARWLANRRRTTDAARLQHVAERVLRTALA